MYQFLPPPFLSHECVVVPAQFIKNLLRLRTKVEKIFVDTSARKRSGSFIKISSRKNSVSSLTFEPFNLGIPEAAGM